MLSSAFSNPPATFANCITLFHEDMTRETITACSLIFLSFFFAKSSDSLYLIAFTHASMK